MIELDAGGDAYLAGTTSSADFPTTAGAYDRTFNGASDLFVAKLNADGSDLIYSTFIGGPASDFAHGSTVFGSGEVFATGRAGLDFPTTSGAYDQTYNGGTADAFVARMNPSGSDLVYSTFIGGESDDHLAAAAVDASGAAYVVGGTASSSYPTTPGAFDTTWTDLATRSPQVQCGRVTLVYGTCWAATMPRPASRRM